MKNSDGDAGASHAPDGTVYPLPDEERDRAEVEALQEWAKSAGRPVVVVQGVGFVGSAMAVAVASSRDASGNAKYSVIGVDLPRPATFWKICQGNAGRLPVDATDAELVEAHRRAVKDENNLRFSWLEAAYALADIIVVDINLDVDKQGDGAFDVNIAPFEAAIRAVGASMRPDALVMVESTVPPGPCARVVVPALSEEIRRRGLGGDDYLPQVAHSPERVMPGPNYLGSIIRIWRVFSGNTPAAAARARELLSDVIDVENFPLTELADTTSSEMAKVLENSYRTTNIALVHEWTRMAESAGVDLFAIVEAIRKREGTHDNLRYPGFGVGGYCLTKDALLADWAAREVFGMDDGLAVAAEAVRINDAMPDHTFEHVQSSLGSVQGKRVLILGVSYLAGVADTRATPTDLLVERILAGGGQVVLCDPLVSRWEERPDATILPSPFDVRGEVDAVVFALPHEEFKVIDPERLIGQLGRPVPVIDAQFVISDTDIARYQELGCPVRAVGRGNIG
jgi:UDP-N-acetyl-D-glucosamine dehydrogenase